MSMRELTPQEIAEGKRGINDQLLSATQVQALVRRMDGSKKKWRHFKLQGKTAEYAAAVKKENEELFFNYPSLYDLHLNDKLDSTFFEMLQLKRKIEKGELTAEQASQIVGQQLFNRFVPVVAEAPPPAPRLSYEEYCRQMGQE